MQFIATIYTKEPEPWVGRGESAHAALVDAGGERMADIITEAENAKCVTFGPYLFDREKNADIATAHWVSDGEICYTIQKD